MDTDAYSPFAAQCFAWRGPGGQWTLTVVCKATFTLAPGMSPVLRESEPIHDVDVRDGEGSSASVRAPSDLAPIKKRADIVVVGSAFAPPNAPVSSLVARVKVGAVDKAIRVVAPRTVMKDGTVREGAPWTEMSIGWDRAAGGEGTSNPAGIARAQLDRHGRRSLPNLEPPGSTLDLEASIAPVGLGAIAPEWPTRKRYVEAHAGAFEPGWEGRPFPASLDVSYFQVAPEDQQLERIPSGVTIMLEHLHREHPRLETRLEPVRPSASAEARGRPTRAIPLVCDTLWIDTDRAIACLVWRGHLAIDSQDEYGLVTVCDEKDLQSTGELRAAVGLAQGGALRATEIQDRDEEPAEVEYQHTATDGETIAHSQAVPPLDPLPFRRPAVTALRTVPEPPPSWAPVAVAAPAPASTPSPSGLRETVGQRAAPRPKAEPEARHVLEVAALAGAVQASHAAADQVARESSSGAARAPDAPLDVVWFDPAVAGRVRARADWRAFHREPVAGPLDDEARVKDARARADRATIAAAVARAEPVLDIEGFVLGSVSEDGALEPRLAVVAGVIEWTFDEIETLKIWTATAAALAPGDKRVKELVDVANETMGTPLGGEADVAASFVVRLRDAWTKAQKSLPNDYIDSHARRLLLQERKYQKKTFGDTEWLRGVLTRDGSDTPVPIYIPATAARSLPLFVRIEGRILGDLVPQQDETEKSSVAVRVAALGRVVGARGRVG